MVDLESMDLAKLAAAAAADTPRGARHRGPMPLYGGDPAIPGFLLSRDGGRLLAVEDGDGPTLATLDLATGHLSVDLGAISHLDRLIQVTHAMAGHPESVSARRGWGNSAAGRLWLLDRNAMFTALADQLGVTEARPAPVGALAWVDVDNLKYINDRMGHRVGDQVIEALAERLQRIAGDAVVARVGADEFVLLFDNLTPVQAAQIVAGASCDAMGPVVTDVGEIPVTFSAGVTDLSGSSADEVMSRADATLYQAKRGGRDQIRIYGESTAAFVGERRDLFGTIEALIARNAQLAREARTDALTGIPNRRALDDAVEASERTRVLGQVDHVLFLDLDRFSAFNKTQGQEAGDEALRTVASILSADLREGDTCFRRGGEEFVVLLPGTSRVASIAVAERIRAAVEAARVPHGGHPDSPVLTLTVVVGGLSAPTTVSSVIEREATAAFGYKMAGIRNCVITLDED